MKLAALTVVLAALSGCSFDIVRGNPRPNVDLPTSKKSLALVIDPSIPDQFTIPPQNGITSANVAGWRDTLQAGFANGFSSSFKPPSGSAADLSLQIVEAVPEFAPTAVSATRGAVAAEAHVRYKVHLLDASGNVLKRSAGTSVSKASMTNAADATATVASALESMYEKVAQDFFLEHS